MKKRIIWFFLCLCTVSFTLAFAASWQYVPVKLIRVIDGDTVDVSLESRPTRVRLLGINTPEMDTLDGRVAKKLVKQILADREIVLAHQNITGAYGRLLGHILVDGRSLADIIRQQVKLMLAKEKGCIFVSSTNSGKFHYPNCRFTKKIEAKALIIFDSAKEATSLGYVPCKVCKPPCGK